MPSRPAVLALGFRPLYLLACVYALISVPLWIAQYRGWFAQDGYFVGVTWHAHELIFGFAAAVISGFLLTAVRNWTQQPTPSGSSLGALSLLWIAGRILCWTGPGPLAAFVDLLFLPVVGVAIGIPLIKTRNTNLFVLVVIGVLFLVNLTMHLQQLGIVNVTLYPNTVDVAFDVLAILMATIAGRITPVFIKNFVKGSAPKRSSTVEFAAVGLLVALLIVDGFGLAASLPTWLLVTVYIAAALAHFIRVAMWQPTATLREPLLWILPLSYVWIPIWLLLRAAVAQGLVLDVIQHHALAIGAMTSLMLGMMTRSALGHTGRALHAGVTETSAFILIQLAVLLRIVPLIVSPLQYQTGLNASAVCWTAAFAVITIKYAPILMTPRVDGKPG